MKKRIQVVLDTLDHVVVTPEALVLVSISKHGRPPAEMAAEFISILGLKKGEHLRHKIEVKRHVDTQFESTLILKITGVLNHGAKIIIRRLNACDKDKLRGFEPSFIFADQLLPSELGAAHYPLLGRHPHAERDLKLFDAL